MAPATRTTPNLQSLSPTKWSYPATRRSDRVDTYKSKLHGDILVKDPYQWLEEATPETDAWIECEEGPARHRHLFANSL